MKQHYQISQDLSKEKSPEGDFSRLCKLLSIYQPKMLTGNQPFMLIISACCWVADPEPVAENNCPWLLATVFVPHGSDAKTEEVCCIVELEFSKLDETA